MRWRQVVEQQQQQQQQQHDDTSDNAHVHKHSKDDDHGVLRCPSCGRDVVVAKVDRVLFAQSTRCPYPACAAPIITVLRWSDESPSALYTQAELARLLRRKLIADVPAFLFAQTILFAAIYAAGYAIEHVHELPPPETFVQSMTQLAIGVGAVGLALPAALLAFALAGCGYRRVRDDRESLTHLTMAKPPSARAAPGGGFRLAPCPSGYRS